MTYVLKYTSFPQIFRNLGAKILHTCLHERPDKGQLLLQALSDKKKGRDSGYLHLRGLTFWLCFV